MKKTIVLLLSIYICMPAAIQSMEVETGEQKEKPSFELLPQEIMIFEIIKQLILNPQTSFNEAIQGIVNLSATNKFVRSLILNQKGIIASLFEKKFNENPSPENRHLLNKFKVHFLKEKSAGKFEIKNKLNKPILIVLQYGEEDYYVLEEGIRISAGKSWQIDIDPKEKIKLYIWRGSSSYPEAGYTFTTDKNIIVSYAPESNIYPDRNIRLRPQRGRFQKGKITESGLSLQNNVTPKDIQPIDPHRVPDWKTKEKLKILYPEEKRKR